MSVNLNRFFSKFPEIRLDNIVLRDLMLKDKHGYLEMMSDEEVSKYLSDEDVPSNIHETEVEIKFWGGLFYRKQSVFWTIANKENDEFMGTIGYNVWNNYNKRAEISYDLKREHWRKGIMSKAMHNVIVFGFKQMGLMRIEARTMLDNIPSQKILEKLGFKREGVLRNYRYIRGESTDVVMYSLTPSDYEKELSD